MSVTKMIKSSESKTAHEQPAVTGRWTSDAKSISVDSPTDLTVRVSCPE
jgi:hypothetical protein